MLWRHYGGEQVNKASRRHFNAFFQSWVSDIKGWSLCTKSKVLWPWWLCVEGNRWEFQCLLHSVTSAGTLSLEAVLWGWLPFATWKFLTGVFMMAASCLLFPSPCSFVFHFCFPNATSFQALYFFHVSGIIFFFTQLLILSHMLLLKGTEHCLFVHWLPFTAWNNSSAAVLGLYHSRAVPGARCCLSSLVYV